MRPDFIMAYRIWSQISKKKIINSCTIRTFAPISNSPHIRINKVQVACFLKQTSPCALRQLSDGRSSASDEPLVARGRFIRNAVDPASVDEDVTLRPSVRYRIRSGTKYISEQALNHKRMSTTAPYRLRHTTGTNRRVLDNRIKEMRLQNYRNNRSNLQPHSLTAFCSRIPTFEREDLRKSRSLPRRVVCNPADRFVSTRHFSATTRDSDTASNRSQESTRSELYEQETALAKERREALANLREQEQTEVRDMLSEQEEYRMLAQKQNEQRVKDEQWVQEANFHDQQQQNHERQQESYKQYLQQFEQYQQQAGEQYDKKLQQYERQLQLAQLEQQEQQEQLQKLQMQPPEPEAEASPTPSTSAQGSQRSRKSESSLASFLRKINPVRPRKYSTFLERSYTSNGSQAMQVRFASDDCILVECCPMKKKCKKKKRKLTTTKYKAISVPKKKKKRIHKHPRDEYWTKCECCPEMLDCHEFRLLEDQRFPCPREPHGSICPIECLPPCEHPPMPEMPLPKPKKTPRYIKVKECKLPCRPRTVCYAPKKKLPYMPPGRCPCPRPYVPDKNPPMRSEKRRCYQCVPECPPPCCITCVDYCVLPKCPPCIIPGDCPCIETTIRDAPPLRRLNLHHVQKTRQCKPGCKPRYDYPVCVPKKKLPRIKTGCYCVEPPRMVDVKLVRLPKICACPPPPDPKCAPPCVNHRADVVCCYNYPTKRLKDWWCPKCKIPKKKYKWCPIHTRGQKRRMSTMAKMQLVRDCQAWNSSKNALHAETMATPIAANSQATGTNLCLNTTNTCGFMSRRYFHATLGLSRKTKKTKKCDKWNKNPCIKLKKICCPPKSTDRTLDCGGVLRELCCKKRPNPYPSFSECGEYNEMLTCECQETMPYLQPASQSQSHRVHDVIVPPVMPKHRKVDPIFEEHCVLRDLCRPYGHTWTCDSFNREPRPLRQYECFSPHRLPCCERDQICDFRRQPPQYTCTGRMKERTYYRCENLCFQKPCKQKTKFGLKQLYSRVKGKTKRRRRYYSTMLPRAPIATSAPSTSMTPQIFGKNPLCAQASTSSAQKGPLLVARRLYRGHKGHRDVGGPTGWPKCQKRCREKKRCGRDQMKKWKKWRPMGLENLNLKAVPIDRAVGAALEKFIKKSRYCHPSCKQTRARMFKKAQCAARRVGMKLVPNHKRSCRMHKHDKCSAAQLARCKNCKGAPQGARAKNICDGCVPRYVSEECRAYFQPRPCCEMPYVMTGDEFIARMPDCCKTPMPPCCQRHRRCRATCRDFFYRPCCVIEPPYPAFTDYHPPFKRLVRSESEWQEIELDRFAHKANKLLSPGRFRKLKPRCRREFSTASWPQKRLLDKILSYVESKSFAKIEDEQQKGLHEAVFCDCPKYTAVKRGVRFIKPDLRRNTRRRTADSIDPIGISGVPQVLMDKDDIFRQVDNDNLISLAPANVKAIDKLKSYVFNAVDSLGKDEQAPIGFKVGHKVDGFEYFSQTHIKRNHEPQASAKQARPLREVRSSLPTIPEEDSSTTSVPESKPVPKKRQPEKKAIAKKSANVVTISSPSDLIYVTGNTQQAINLRPRVSTATKVKVMPNPICTHIMLDSGELMLEREYFLMRTLMPMKKRLYIPFGLSHEEYVALEEVTSKNVQGALDKVLLNMNRKST